MVFLWITKEVKPAQVKVIAGHWVSLVGYGQNEIGEIDPNFLILHDPGSGFDYKKNDFVELKFHNTDIKADKQNFKNHYELMEFDCKNGADNIFLSGGLCFNLKK